MEGAITFASLVVGVAVTQQLLNLHYLLRERTSVRWDPLCLLVAGLVQLTIIMLWWGISKGQEGPMTIGAFLPIFVTLVLMFLLAAVSLPDPRDDDARDLKAYYDHNGSYIWTLFLLSVLVLAVAGLVHDLDGRTLAGYVMDRAVDLVVLPALMLSLVLVRRRWWHWIVVGFLSLMALNWLGRSIG